MLTLLLVLAAAPPVTLSAPDARGCGRALVAGLPAKGGPGDFCVRQLVEAPLEPGERNVVLLVDAPHRFDPTVRPRVFVYRLRGRTLVPRFLGSGFSSVAVARLAAADDGLRVMLKEGAALDCRFEGFPLVCEEASR